MLWCTLLVLSYDADAVVEESVDYGCFPYILCSSYFSVYLYFVLGIFFFFRFGVDVQSNEIIIKITIHKHFDNHVNLRKG